MTAQLDIERVLDDFLAEGASDLSDHVLDAALDDVSTTRQRRAWRVPRRYSDMPTPLRLMAAAAILAAALGGAFLLGFAGARLIKSSMDLESRQVYNADTPASRPSNTKSSVASRVVHVVVGATRITSSIAARPRSGRSASSAH